MLYSHDWLNTMVPQARLASAIADLIGRHVATVDDVRALRQDLSPIVVARVVQAGRHPNSEHLWVTKVDDGSGVLQDVVCGAPNVVAGTLYPFARVGTVMPTGNKGGILIEKRKIRGEWSCGMLCSAKELGLGEDQDGIMPLDLHVPTGTPLLQALPETSDTCLDVDVLPNRPDLLSHRGMAREIGALCGAAVRSASQVIAVETGLAAVASLPPVRQHPHQATSDGVTVRLEDAEGCPCYMGVAIRGITVGASPGWLVARLEALGARSISNVVDATNYVLQAFGQPMHAFDYDKLAQRTIVIRRARAGERLTTLDGVDRALSPSMTLIADADRAVAVAGVMGGRDSEVSATTTSVFLEVACFEPRGVRRTRKALGLSTDASHRFERGIDPGAMAEVLEAATQLIIAVAGGAVTDAPIHLGSPPAPPAVVSFPTTRVAHLLGADVSAGEVVTLLGGIGFDVSETNGILQVNPPTWRGDVLRDADVVEEVARLRGFDTLSDELRPFRPGSVPDHPHAVTTRALRALLVGEGLLEARPMPFVSASDATHVRVSNPLAADEPHLRRVVIESLATRAEYNLSRMEGNVRLFEVGAVFAPGEGTLPREAVHAGALIMGLSRPPHFTDPRPPAYDVWDARALGERMATCVHGPGVTLVAAENGGEGGVLWFMQREGSEVGRVLRVPLDRPVWAHEAFGVELWIGYADNADVAAPGAHAVSTVHVAGAATLPRLTVGGIVSAVSGHQTTPPLVHAVYRPLATTPAAEFDLALLLPAGLAVATVERVLRESAGALLENLVVFDEFRGPGLPEGMRSVAWRLTFRDPTRTLRDKEVDGRRSKILQTLERELGIRPRSG